MSGGRPLTWGRQSYRLGDLDFEANAREGTAVDWSIRCREIVPRYDYVERFAGISEHRDGHRRRTAAHRPYTADPAYMWWLRMWS